MKKVLIIVMLWMLITSSNQGEAYISQFTPLLGITGQTGTAMFKKVMVLGRGTINTASWSPDGRTLAVGGSRGTWIYEIENGQLQAISHQPLGSNIATVFDMAWNANSEMLAVASFSDNRYSIIIWDVQENAQIAVLEDNLTRIIKLAWQPNGDYLAVGTDDGKLHLWKWDTWETEILVGHAGEIIDIAWSPNGTWLASSGQDNSIRIWSKEIAAWHSDVYSEHTATITQIAWNPNSQQLASAGYDQIVHVWDVSTGGIATSFQHSASVLALAWKSDGNTIASGDNAGIEIWSASNGSPIAHISVPLNSIDQLAWTNSYLVGSGRQVIIWEPLLDGGYAETLVYDMTRSAHMSINSVEASVLVSYDNLIHLYDIATGTLLDTLLDHNGTVTAMSWNNTSTQLGGLSSDGSIKTWEVDNGQIEIHFPAEISPDDGALAWNSDWTLLATTGIGGEGLVIYDWQQITNNPSLIPVVANLIGLRGFIVGAAWTKDESKIVGITAVSDQYPLVYNTQNGNWFASGTLQNSSIFSTLTVAANPSSQAPFQIALGGTTMDGEGYVQLWELSTNQLIDSKAFNTLSIEAIAWSPDGTSIAAVENGDDTVYLWDLGSQAVTELVFNDESLQAIAWSSGNLLAIASYKNIYLWDMSLAEPEQVQLIENEASSALIEIAWSLDGNKLASSDDTGVIAIWAQTILDSAMLIAPTGTISDPTPTYTWHDVPEATEFKLTVENEGGTVLQATYLRSVCSDNTCAVTPTTALAEGNYWWTIQTINAAGDGPVSEALNFTVDRRE